MASDARKWDERGTEWKPIQETLDVLPGYFLKWYMENRLIDFQKASQMASKPRKTFAQKEKNPKWKRQKLMNQNENKPMHPNLPSKKSNKEFT